MLEGEAKRKMTYALKIMTTNKNGTRYLPTARTFEYVREQSRQAQIGVPLDEERKRKISKSIKGMKQSEETKKKRADALRGQKRTEETRIKMSESAKARAPMSEETKAKIKEARALQIITTKEVTCPHCGKTGGNRIMPRYHFNNCKSRGF